MIHSSNFAWQQVWSVMWLLLLCRPCWQLMLLPQWRQLLHLLPLHQLLCLKISLCTCRLDLRHHSMLHSESEARRPECWGWQIIVWSYSRAWQPRELLNINKLQYTALNTRLLSSGCWSPTSLIFSWFTCWLREGTCFLHSLSLFFASILLHLIQQYVDPGCCPWVL